MQNQTSVQTRNQPPLRPFFRLLAEMVGVGVPFFLYFLTRGAVADRATEAFLHGGRLVDVERGLGIFREAQIQAAFLPRQGIIDLFNFIYFWGHFPLILAIAFPLYFWRRPVYTFLRNSLIASGALGLLIYVAFPVAPPRLMPHLGFVDTMDIFSAVSYQSESVSTFANPFAAVPSLHFGWALIIGITFIWMFRHPVLRALGLAWPFVQGAAIIITANHFFLDAVAGGLVSLAGFGIALLIYRRQQERERVANAAAHSITELANHG